MNQSHPQLANYPVVIEIPVQWGDQDAIGHVNNIVPLRWFESARIAYFEKIGMGSNARGDGMGFILAASQCDYRRQITYPDTVQIGARVVKLGNTSLTFHTRVISQAENQVAVEGESVVVMFDYDNQCKEAISPELRAAITELQGDI